MEAVKNNICSSQAAKKDIYRPANVIKAVLLSLFGIFLIFVNIEINEQKSIPLDHMISFILTNFGQAAKWFAVIMIFIGVIKVYFIDKTWNKGAANIFFSIMKLFSLPFSIMFLFNTGPAFLMKENIIPFLYNRVVVQWVWVIITGSICLAFLANFGLFEFVGVLARPLMRKVWSLPGFAAINAVACFVGSFTVGTVITNNLYKKGKYTTKEAVILLVGFGTVSATFMIILARSANIMQYWSIFFFSCMLVTFIVTAVNVRLWPVSKVPEVYWENEPDPEVEVNEKRFQTAIAQALETSDAAPNLLILMKIAIWDAFKVIWGLMPTMGGLGIILLLLLDATPVFDWISYIFYPVTYLLSLIGLSDPAMIAKSVAIATVEPTIACVVASGAELATRFATAVTCVSVIVFWTGSLPCFLVSDIEFSVGKYMIVMLERMIIALTVAFLLSKLIFTIVT